MEDMKMIQLNEQEELAMHTDDHIRPTKEFVSPESLYEELIASVRRYHPSTDISLIEKAYKIADEAHTGQVRKSGEAYIIHPLCVAIILAELELDKETIVAGILHDVVEDTVMTEEEISQEFSEEVSPNWASCPMMLTRWRFRQKICAKCFWPWQRISG